MKKVKLFSFALAALMLGACTNEDVIDNGGQGTVAPGEKGYISLAINLPTTPSTRANDDFDKGLEAEYKVNDATLLIFSGADEMNATFSGAYNLATSFPAGQDGNITTTSQIVQDITTPVGDNVYALVVLNKDGLLSESNGTWTYGSTQFTATTKFSDFAYTAQNLDLSKIANAGGENFLMLNAPLYSNAGGATDPTTTGTLTTLTKINKENIFSTATEAKNNPAAKIFVERAVAKVTVNQGAAYDAGTYQAAIQGWTLDITNKSTFPVRKIETATPWWSYKNQSSDDYRFVGSAAVSTNLYRTYWGVDPNYDGTYGNSTSYLDGDGNVLSTYDGFNTISGTAPTSLITAGSNAYCMENTFNVANMKKDQTTRVIVAAQLTVSGADADGGFYVLNNAKDVIYNKTSLENLIKNAYLQNSTIDALLHGADGLDLQSGEQFGGDDIIVNFESDGSKSTDISTLNGGNIIVADVYVNPASNTKFKNDVIPTGLASDNAGVTASINNSNKISYYKKGIAYYPVLIKHFDELTQTPWDGTGLNESYPSPNAESNWLGRYGVLRNNWYEINVNAIKSIGSAEVEPEYGYDDPVESWISVEINVLSWAKRSQSVGL